MNKNVLFLLKERKWKSSYHFNKAYLSSKREFRELSLLYMEIWTKTPILIKIPINRSLMSYYWFYVKSTGTLFEKYWKSLKKKSPRRKPTINIPLSGPYWFDEILRLWHSCRCQPRPPFQPCPAWYQSQCNSQFGQHQHCKKLNKPKELQEPVYATLNKDPFGIQIDGIEITS